MSKAVGLVWGRQQKWQAIILIKKLCSYKERRNQLQRPNWQAGKQRYRRTMNGVSEHCGCEEDKSTSATRMQHAWQVNLHAFTRHSEQE